jgi:hypothetical protein
VNSGAFPREQPFQKKGCFLYAHIQKVWCPLQLGITYERLSQLGKVAPASLDLLLVVLPALSPRRLKRVITLTEAALEPGGTLILTTSQMAALEASDGSITNE